VQISSDGKPWLPQGLPCAKQNLRQPRFAWHSKCGRHSTRCGKRSLREPLATRGSVEPASVNRIISATGVTQVIKSSVPLPVPHQVLCRPHYQRHQVISATDVAGITSATDVAGNGVFVRLWTTFSHVHIPLPHIIPSHHSVGAKEYGPPPHVIMIPS